MGWLWNTDMWPKKPKKYCKLCLINFAKDKDDLCEDCVNLIGTTMAEPENTKKKLVGSEQCMTLPFVLNQSGIMFNWDSLCYSRRHPESPTNLN